MSLILTIYDIATLLTCDRLTSYDNIKSQCIKTGRPLIQPDKLQQTTKQLRALFHEVQQNKPTAASSDEITVGSYVKVKKEITRPAFGWGGVTPNSVGKVTSISLFRGGFDEVVVKFPGHLCWGGYLSELELATSFAIVNLSKAQAGTLASMLDTAGSASVIIEELKRLFNIKTYQLEIDTLTASLHWYSRS